MLSSASCCPSKDGKARLITEFTVGGLRSEDLLDLGCCLPNMQVEACREPCSAVFVEGPVT